MSDPFTRAVDGLFAHLGADAVYTPQAGAPATVRVIPRRPDQVVGFGETRLHSETTVFDVRVSEVPSPQSGDTIALDGTTYVVQGEPRRQDPDRLIWSVDTWPA